METPEIDALLERLEHALDETHRIQGEVLELFRLMLAKSRARTSQAGRDTVCRHRSRSRFRRRASYFGSLRTLCTMSCAVARSSRCDSATGIASLGVPSRPSWSATDHRPVNPLTNKLSAGVGGVVRLGLTEAIKKSLQMSGSVGSSAVTMVVIAGPCTADVSQPRRRGVLRKRWPPIAVVGKAYNDDALTGVTESRSPGAPSATSEQGDNPGRRLESSPLHALSAVRRCSLSRQTPSCVSRPSRLLPIWCWLPGGMATRWATAEASAPAVIATGTAWLDRARDR